MALRSNGPRVGATTGRNRNALGNLLSKQNLAQPSVQTPVAPTRNASVRQRRGAILPPPSPEQANAYTQQLQNLQGNFILTRRQLAEQAANLRAQRRSSRADIRAQEISALAGVENNALDRGILGSTVDVQGRIGAQAAAASAQADARNALLQGLQGVHEGRMQNWMNLRTGITNLAAQQAADQWATALANFQNGIFNTSGSTGGAGKKAPSAGATAGDGGTNTPPPEDWRRSGQAIAVNYPVAFDRLVNGNLPANIGAPLAARLTQLLEQNPDEVIAALQATGVTLTKEELGNRLYQLLQAAGGSNG